MYIVGGVPFADADANNSKGGKERLTPWQGFGGGGGGGSNVETDAELEKNIGDGSYYLPSYFTALVGRGLKGAHFTCFIGTKVRTLTRPQFTLLH